MHRKLQTPLIIGFLGVLSVMLMGCPEHACLPNSINPAFIGFAPADIDTIVLRAYKRDDNYQHLADTVVIINRNAVVYTTLHDTTIVDVNSSDPNHFINPNFDWQVYIPAKHRTVSVSNIQSDAAKGKGQTCLNPILSYVQDGQTITPHLVETGKFYTSGYMVYIQN